MPDLFEFRDEMKAESRAEAQALVKGISFTINKGEVFALVGESGSGKSLTALSVLRLLPDALIINGGSIKLMDENLFSLTEMEMNSVRGRKVAMVFQEPQSTLNPVQTVGDQVYEVLKLHKNLPKSEGKKEIIELFSEVGIPKPEQRFSWYHQQLSGGQNKRIMIAMALASETDLLVADEPTTALDVTIQKQILTLLNELRKKRGLTILLITHDMGVVSEMADRIAVMRDGEIIEQANKDNFFHAPKTDYSKKLIAALPDTHHFITTDKKPIILKLNDLKVWFPIKAGIFQRTVDYTKAVNGVSLSIKEGETLALVGESGCGKTTLGKAILRLTEITEGAIEFQGKKISGLSHKNYLPYRRDIQVIFQDPFSSMNPRMTIRNIIEEGMISLGVEPDEKKREQKILHLMSRGDLDEDFLSRYPHEFSGGQRQRSASVRALAVHPKLIICDEPTSALDVSIRGQVLRLLKKLQDEEKFSYLFITHDLSLVPYMAHTVAVMKEGVIVEQGATQQVMEQPQHDYTKKLLASVPVIK